MAHVDHIDQNVSDDVLAVRNGALAQGNRRWRPARTNRPPPTSHTASRAKAVANRVRIRLVHARGIKIADNLAQSCSAMTRSTIAKRRRLTC